MKTIVSLSTRTNMFNLRPTSGIITNLKGQKIQKITSGSSSCFLLLHQCLRKSENLFFILLFFCRSCVIDTGQQMDGTAMDADPQP